MKSVGHDGSTPPPIAVVVPVVNAGLALTSAIGMGPEVLALAFGLASAGMRRRVLGLLLGLVGTLALSVIGGGAFVRGLLQMRAVSAEDTALVTFAEVFALAHYVQQSNPAAFGQILRLLSDEVSTVSALGGSVGVLGVGVLP